MKITKAEFKTSVVSSKMIIDDGVPEFAFVGRSNVGKSSLINCLVNQKKLVKTSSTPGHTKMINYFDINESSFRFVDLPGYGFAKTGKSHQDVWSTLMEYYLLGSKSIKKIFMLVDIRHKPTEQDKQMLSYLFYHNLPICVVATKSDKVPKSKISNYLSIIASELALGKDNIIAFSSETGFGKEKVLEVIEKSL